MFRMAFAKPIGPWKRVRYPNILFCDRTTCLIKWYYLEVAFKYIFGKTEILKCWPRGGIEWISIFEEDIIEILRHPFFFFGLKLDAFVGLARYFKKDARAAFLTENDVTRRVWLAGALDLVHRWEHVRNVFSGIGGSLLKPRVSYLQRIRREA